MMLIASNDRDMALIASNDRFINKIKDFICNASNLTKFSLFYDHDMMLIASNDRDMALIASNDPQHNQRFYL
jgi:hypothetical protein